MNVNTILDQQKRLIKLLLKTSKENKSLELKVALYEAFLTEEQKYVVNKYVSEVMKRRP